MKIDAHQHFWRYQPSRDTWITAEMGVLRRDFLLEDLLPELVRNEFESTIAVQADSSEAETEFLLKMASRHNEIYSVVGWVDLCAPNICERLAHFAPFEKLAGFRHIVQAEPDDRFLLRSDFLRGIAALAEFEFTYDILIYPKQLPAAIDFVERFPDQRFVVDHLAKPAIRMGEIDSWSAHMRILASNGNVFCKVSGFVTESDWSNCRAQDFRPYFDVGFEAFGPRRLMFGSDWPVCLLAGTYDQVVKIVADYARQFPVDDQRALFGENAARFYGMRAVAGGSRTRK